MRLFSSQISSFLKRIGSDQEADIAMVPKSDSAGSPGDFVIFRYPVGLRQRLCMLVQPIAKDAMTGNLLLTCLDMDPDEYNSSAELIDLYTNRGSLSEDSYRTFIMSRIMGPLMKLSVE